MDQTQCTCADSRRDVFLILYLVAFSFLNHRDKQIMLQQMQQIGVTPNANMGQQGIDMSMGASGLGIDAQAAAVQQAIAQQQMPLGVQGLPGQTVLPMNDAALAPGAAQATVAEPTNSNDYQFIFNNSSVGMAIASLGGAFVDCNSIFCQLSEFTKEEICAMTIFNMTSRQDLQHAFDLISQMITPALTGAPADATDKGDDKSQSIVLRGAMKNRTDLGLSISLIKGENGIAKCFSVTLVRILSMETTKPDTVSIEMELPQVRATKQQKNINGLGLPAYTSG
jgi:PAS domain-containing protein